jgi:hypothetical protein
MARETHNPYGAPSSAAGQDYPSATRPTGKESPVLPSALAIFAMVLAAAATRLAPHWWNLTAIGAVCLFGGCYFQRRWAAFLVPLAALAVSDILLQMFVYRGFGPNYFKYVCFAATVPLGFALRGRTRVLPIFSAAVASAVLFFLLSNFQVWFGGHGKTYPHTPAGLLACYLAALPFAVNMLYGNLLFSGLLFSGMEWMKSRRAAFAQPAAERALA